MAISKISMAAVLSALFKVDTTAWTETAQIPVFVVTTAALGSAFRLETKIPKATL